MERLLKSLRDDKDVKYPNLTNFPQQVDPHEVFGQQFIPPQQIFNTIPTIQPQQAPHIQQIQGKQINQMEQLQTLPQVKNTINQVTQEQTKESQNIKNKQMKTKEPVESKYPEFIVFKLNNLEHKFEKTTVEFNEEIEKIKEQLQKIQDDTQTKLAKVKKSLAQTLKLIKQMNVSLPEYIENKMNELKLPIESLSRELELRTNSLQQQILLNKHSITELESEILTISQYMDSLSSQLSSIQKQITNLEKQVKHLSRIQDIPRNITIEPKTEFIFLVDYYDYTQLHEEYKKQKEDEKQEENTINETNPEKILEQALKDTEENESGDKLMELANKLIDSYENTTRKFLEEYKESEPPELPRIETDLNKVQMAELIDELSGKRKHLFELQE